MNIEAIDNFLLQHANTTPGCVKISFKKRDTIYGLFIKDHDYEHLRSKNFWRIVTKLHFNEYQKTGNKTLAKIFNGAEFSRLASYSEAVEKAV